MKRKGFTLIELLVVISIISLLSSVVVASLNASREKGRMGGAKYFAAQAEHVAGDQAVAIWDFDEGSGTALADRSGFGNDGVMSSAGWSVDTPSGAKSSGSFNGSRRITVANESNFDFLTNSGQDVTISAWIKTSSSGQQMIVQKGTGTSVNQFRFRVMNGGLSVLYYSATASNYKNPTTSFQVIDGKWHHVLVSSKNIGNSMTISFYVDGAFKSHDNSSAGTYTPATNDYPLYIGGHDSDVSLYFNGLIDDVRIFDKALTASEIGRLYAQGVERLKLADNSSE